MFSVRLMIYSILVASLFACAPVSPQIAQERAQEADVHYKLGISHLQGNNPTLALKELLKAVQFGPNNSESHAALAQAYQMKKAYAKAEQHYLQAISLSDNDPRYMNNIGSLYLDMENWDKAIEYFDLAANNLLFFNPHKALAGKGFAYLKKHDNEKALEFFEEAAAIAPRYAQAYFLQSEAYQAMGKEEQARNALERAITIDPGYVQAFYQLGVLELKAQKTDNAVERFKKVVTLAPVSDWGLKATEMLRALKKNALQRTED